LRKWQKKSTARVADWEENTLSSKIILLIIIEATSASNSAKSYSPKSYGLIYADTVVGPFLLEW
jgi:hypothetical protein